MEASGETTVRGTQILWKEGKVGCTALHGCWFQCVAVQNLTERNPVDSDGGSRKRALEEQASFFSWFLADSGLEEPGEIIRDDIWPNPLQFFLVGHV